MNKPGLPMSSLSLRLPLFGDRDFLQRLVGQADG
jgi:hypothetical protein